eukprot:TRINITY_DN24587_c0_g4_i1.p1 TRINITY_DN24587_c0_g4~~TRINITY_DN24587_c0_g4_i1.p1  ORF type:complete len:1056 (-),score=202.04 TRINITY_DN24587_c0_g4_i1:167-3334(-)
MGSDGSATAAVKERNADPDYLIKGVEFVVLALQIVLFTYAVGWYGVGERWTDVDPRETYHCLVAAFLLTPMIVVEGSFLLSAIFGSHAMQDGAPGTKLMSMRQSSISLLHYFIKISTILCIASLDGGIVHTDSFGFAPARGFCTIRNLQWALACPLMMIITNDSICRSIPKDEVRKRDWPSLVNTFMYCWTAWAALVSVGPMWLKAANLVMSFVAFITVSMDQILLYRSQGQMEQPIGQGIVLGWQIGVFFFYGIVFLLGRFGLVSQLTESMIYAYSDVTVKLFHGALNVLIRSREDMLVIRHFWEMTTTKGEDLERLLRTATVPILSTTLDGEVLVWNDNLVQSTGISEEVARGQKLVQLVSPECREAVGEAIRTHSPDAVHVSILKANANEDEEHRPVKLIVKFVVQRTKEAEPTGLTAIGQDLTEVVLLRQSEERSQQMTGILSHELRSPLHGIIGLSSVMMQTEENAVRKKQLEMIKSSAARLCDMVADITELASQHEMKKKSSGKRQINLEKTNVLHLLREVIGMTRSAVTRANHPLINKNVQLINACPTTAPAIMANGDKLMQLLYNLVTNACKFTKQGSVSITCRKKDNEVQIAITDTGPGIAKQSLSRIFQPFEQARSADNKEIEGIGLGLSIAQEIAKAHSGHISVASELGFGSTFTLHIPALDEYVNIDTIELPRAQPGASQLTDGDRARNPSKPTMAIVEPLQHRLESKQVAELKKKPAKIHVLSVGSNHSDQLAISRALCEMCTVHEALSVEDAVSSLDRAAKPDLILLDASMPGMAGFRALRSIRLKTRRSELPVVMLSADTDVERLTVQAFDGLADDCLAKPVSAEVLRARVAAWIMLGQEWQERVASLMMNRPAAPAASAPSTTPVITQAPKRGSEPMPVCSSDADELFAVRGDDTASKCNLDKLRPDEGASAFGWVASCGSRSTKDMNRGSTAASERDEGMGDSGPTDGSLSKALSQLQHELKIRDSNVASLAKALQSAHTDRYLAQTRIGVLQREVDFLQGVAAKTGFKPTHYSFLDEESTEIDDSKLFGPLLMDDSL